MSPSPLRMNVLKEIPTCILGPKFYLKIKNKALAILEKNYNGEREQRYQTFSLYARYIFFFRAGFHIDSHNPLAKWPKARGLIQFFERYVEGISSLLKSYWSQWLSPRSTSTKEPRQTWCTRQKKMLKKKARQGFTWLTQKAHYCWYAEAGWNLSKRYLQSWL